MFLYRLNLKNPIDKVYREEEFAQQEAALAALETDRAALRANVEGLESRVTHLESELERSQRQASADGETNAKIADLEEQLRMRTEEIDETEDRCECVHRSGRHITAYLLTLCPKTLNPSKRLRS